MVEQQRRGERQRLKGEASEAAAAEGEVRQRRAAKQAEEEQLGRSGHVSGSGAGEDAAWQQRLDQAIHLSSYPSKAVIDRSIMHEPSTVYIHNPRIHLVTEASEAGLTWTGGLLRTRATRVEPEASRTCGSTAEAALEE